jgi:Type I site-specific restriction-modification system, R (restriction) subunit and related helicases
MLSTVKSKYPTCSDFERSFPSICYALATGVGKTRLMGACISYLYLEYGVKNFFVLAPNLTIYNKLIEDFSNPQSPKYVFRGIADFSQNAPRIINGDNYNQFSGNELFQTININVFNISKINSETRGGNAPRIKRMSEYLGDSYFNYLSGLSDLVILMDESHHYRADRGMAVINELDPILGLEFTATPQTQSGTKYTKFKNVVYEYSLANAIKDGFVKKPAVATRKDFDPSHYSPSDLDRLKLLDGVRIHENTKAELAIYARDKGVREVKPFMLVVAVDTAHAAQLKEIIQQDDFFNGYYKDKVMDIHSNQSGSEKDENIELLLSLEDPNNRIEIVIHVNMLKEGWDVTNLYTIVPLRTSASRTLTEQTIGRGLRLPYGTHTGDDSVDTLTIVQHDKFQDIVDEANKPDSIIRVQNIIVIDEEDEGNYRKEIISPQSTLKADIEKRKEEVKQMTGSKKEKEILDIKRDEFILPFINKVAPKAASFTKEAVTNSEAIETFKQAYKTQLESEGHLFAEAEAIEAAVRYVAIAEKFIDKVIPIPRLVIQPSGVTRLVFKDFDLNTSKMKYQPGSEEIITRELQSGMQRTLSTGTVNYREKYIENHIVSLLMDKQEIWYDEHKDLLYKLANQAVNHFKSYLTNDKDVLNVILTFKIPIAEQIYQQMMVNYEIVHDGFEKPVMTVRPCSEIKDPVVSKNMGERIYDFKENIEPISQIRNKVFGGFTKALHNLYKFDSKTEKDFASILEQDKDCLKWLRPAKSQFQIYYGHPSREYMPDFVVETSKYIALVETKKKDDIETETVKSKAKAALNYCINATEYNKQIGGKPWKYILIPHDSVKLNMDIEYLFSQYEVTD